jgi:hypothetical protein
MCEIVPAMKIITPILVTLVVLAAFLYGGSLAGVARIWLIDIGLLIISFGVMAAGRAACGEINTPEDSRDVLPLFDFGISKEWQ